MRQLILYLTNEGLQVREGGQVLGTHFSADETGLQQFAEWARLHPAVPATLLVDVVEEDFHRETLPHLNPLARARQAMVERKLGQLYRDTPFRKALLQGRTPDGRRDDMYLFTALTNAANVQPWIEVLVAAEVPVARIFSVSLLVQVLHKRLALGRGNVLVVTHHAAGLRQTYFHEGQLRFSRLRMLPPQDSVSVAGVIDQETARTRQFLAGSRLVPRDANLDVVVMGAENTMAALLALEQPAAQYRHAPLAEVARLIGVKLPPERYCESLFVHLATYRPPPSHYTLPETARVFQQWVAGIGLRGAAAAVAMLAIGWAGLNVSRALDDMDRIERFADETRVAEHRYRAVMADLPPFSAHPLDMKTAVNLHQLLESHYSDPFQIGAAISRALETQPDVRLNRLEWQLANPDQIDVLHQEGRIALDNELPPDAALLGVPHRPAVGVWLEGEVLPFGKDYRRALEQVRAFAALLAREPGWEAEIVALPLDEDPSATVAGRASPPSGEERATFGIRMKRKG